MIKKGVSCVLFCVLLALLVFEANEFVISKAQNRYYMLEKEIENLNESYDVQIYGSCHAYTSFMPLYIKEKYGKNGYNLSNPSEIIPVTYLRMRERFKKDLPSVVFVETWGINAYETYIATEEILGSFLKPNLDGIPLSKEKLEVMRDFSLERMLDENLAVIKYKDRLINGGINDLDSSYENGKKEYFANNPNPSYEEMALRFERNGYKLYPSYAREDYKEQQAKIEAEEMMEVEGVMMKYIDKIIDLCKEYNVKLIFYRAPYRSTANELRKINYLEEYLAQRGVSFYDLEKEIDFDIMVDFYDYEHLGESGALKATEYLSEKAAAYLN